MSNPARHDGSGETGAAIGTPVERIEDLRFLRGRGCYVDDLTRPGMLHAVVLRSPIAHGRLVAIDASGARALTGVHAVFTAGDIAADHAGSIPRIPMRQEALPELEPFHQPVIAQSKVRYVGEPLAIVVAETPAIAEDALDAIAVEIEPLPVVADCAASEAGAARLFEEAESNCAIVVRAAHGDADAVFAAAPYTRRERFRVHRHTALPMETRGLLADWDPVRGRLIVHGVAKVPFPNRRVLARQLGLEVDDIDMIETDVGGGFGVRGELYPEDFLVPYAARRLGRPVKWIEDRREHLLATNHAREAECELEIACDRDGRILALRGRARTDVGAYLRTNGVTPSRNIAQVASGPYRIEHVDMRVSVMLTNKTPAGTYRGPGRFETDFFRERLIDMAAADLGIDRVAMRRRNLIGAADMPWQLPATEPFGGTTATDTGDYAAALDRCLEEFGWEAKRALDGRLIDGRYHGIAVGCYIEGGAAGPRESARLVLETDGTVSVYTGSSAVGQGLETVFAQIAADTLQLPIGAIRGVFHGSTSGVKEGFGSYSSRSVVMGGSAVVRTGAKLLDTVRESAARHFGCRPDDVRIEHGQVIGPGEKILLLAEFAQAHGPFEAEDSFSSGTRTYSYGTHAAHVAVDVQTGAVEVLDYVAVEDVGRIVNPHTLHGQTLGAIVQGLGGVFLEHLVYGDDGQLLTGSLADYVMPTATEFARIRVIALEDYPSPSNPLGAKGAGEGGIIPVGGVAANAVASALRSFGVAPNELPLSPQRVWELVHGSRNDVPGGGA